MEGKKNQRKEQIRIAVYEANTCHLDLVQPAQVALQILKLTLAGIPHLCFVLALWEGFVPHCNSQDFFCNHFLKCGPLICSCGLHLLHNNSG